MSHTQNVTLPMTSRSLLTDHFSQHNQRQQVSIWCQGHQTHFMSCALMVILAWPLKPDTLCTHSRKSINDIIHNWRELIHRSSSFNWLQKTEKALECHTIYSLITIVQTLNYGNCFTAIHSCAMAATAGTHGFSFQFYQHGSRTTSILAFNQCFILCSWMDH